MIKYNLDKIISVRLMPDKELAWYILWKDELKFLGIRFRKAGFYRFVQGECSDELLEKLPDGHFVENHSVYYPRNEVVIKYVDGNTTTHKFETQEDAVDFYNSTMSSRHFKVLEVDDK